MEPYLYFIESHELMKKVEIKLNTNDEYDYENKLELLHSQNHYSLEEKIEYHISIYRIKINEKLMNKKIKNATILPIILENEGNKYEAQTNQDIQLFKNCFLFDLRFVKKHKWSKEPPKELIMYNSFKFDLYMKVLKLFFITNISDKNCQDLLCDAQKFLNGYLEDKKKKLNEYLYFFIDILIEYIDEKKLVKNHILMFNINKIGDKNSQYINTENVILKTLIESIIINIEKFCVDFDENCKQKLILLFFNFIYIFQKDIIYKMLDNAYMKEYIFDIIYENPQKYIISFNKEHINALIQRSKTFNKIHEMLSLNNKFLDILEVINKTIFYIISTIGDKKLLMEKYVKPTINDDLDKIYEQINLLLNFEQANTFFVRFNEKIFNAYLDFYKENDFHKLISVYKIVKLIKEKDRNFKFNLGKIQKKIKDRSKILIKENNIENSEILDCLLNIENFSEDEMSKLIEKFDITDKNSEIWKKWKKVNWLQLYKINKIKESAFYTSIRKKIDHPKNFEKIFQLFDIKEDEKDYNQEMIKTMQSVFKSLNVSDSRDPNYVEDVSNLIKYSEKKEVSVIDIVKKNLIINNNVEIIAHIFKRLIENNNNFSKDLQKEIISFFSKNIEKSNISSLSFIIKYKNPLEDKDIRYLNKYILSKQDFFDQEENEKILLFSNIININNIKQKLSNSEYLRKNKSLTENLLNILSKGAIDYKTIIPFYSNKQKELLYNRILIMAFNEEEKAKRISNKVDEYMNKTDIVSTDLNKINDYLKLVFRDSRKDIIKKIENFIKNIYDSNINYCNTIEEEYKELKDKYINDVKDNLIFKNNALFISMINNMKNICKYDEEKSLSETNKLIEMIKNILIDNLIKKADINNLKKYTELIDMNKETLCESLNHLISIFNIKNEVNVDKISNQLILLGQKNKIKFLVDILLYYIEKFNENRTELYSLLKVIKNNINKSEDFKIIELSKSILKNYKIDLGDNDEKFNEILIKLGKNPEKNEFLFDAKNHTGQFMKKLRKINNENNNLFINTEKCISFVKKYMKSEFKKLKDKDLIDVIKNDFGNLDIVNQFNDYIDKYQLLIDNFLL